MGKTAILVDGGFYQRRAEVIYGKQTPEEKVRALIDHCYRHLETNRDKPANELYRIFYYDCPPLDKRVLHPFSKETIDYKKTTKYIDGMAFLDLMKQERKVALRLGTLKGNGSDFIVPAPVVKKLLSKQLSFSKLKKNDFQLDVRQKGVDMRIGVDIASLAYKKQVDQIVLIAGDSDFVPVAKVARREGIDFILDPMWNHISEDLREHIDGLNSYCEKPKNMKKKSTQNTREAENSKGKNTV